MIHWAQSILGLPCIWCAHPLSFSLVHLNSECPLHGTISNQISIKKGLEWQFVVRKKVIWKKGNHVHNRIVCADWPRVYNKWNLSVSPVDRTTNEQPILSHGNGSQQSGHRMITSSRLQTCNGVKSWSVLLFCEIRANIRPDLSKPSYRRKCTYLGWRYD